MFVVLQTKPETQPKTKSEYDNSGNKDATNEGPSLMCSLRRLIAFVFIYTVVRMF